MQKKIIALAVAGLASTAAFAQSNVTIYGQMAAGVEFTNANNGGTNTYRVQDHTSRIGFKGAEDLGNGLKAVWQVESGFSTDTVGTANSSNATGNAATSSGSSSQFGNRNTFVGLNGNFGTVVLGRHDTPYKLSTQKFNLFAGTTAEYNAILGSVSGGASGNNRFDLRANNAIAYISPNFSGFSFIAAHVTPETKEAVAGLKAQAWSFAGMYDNGPIFASLAFENHKDLAQGVNSAAAAPFVPVGLGVGNKDQAWKASFGYTYAPASFVGVLYESMKASYNAAAGGGDDKNKNWGLFAQHALGNVVLKGSYLKGGDTKGANAADDGAKMYTLGADYNLSKRTAVYGYYTKLNNDAAGARNFFYAVPGAAGQAATNVDYSALSFGIRHAF